VANAEGDRPHKQRRTPGSKDVAGRALDGQQPAIGCGTGDVADSENADGRGTPSVGEADERGAVSQTGGCSGIGPVSGFWRSADWIPCSDGKARSVEPGSFPLAHGAPARVVRLRGYGDGIVAPAAEAFVRAYLESPRD
jgi:DNA (cytosine-5)-methyltransferase 1